MKTIPTPTCSLPVLAGLLLFAAAPLTAQSSGAAAPGAAAAEGRRVGWHIVRSGDTLEGLSRHISGNSALWEENWELNPEITDPHRLTPGRRIRLILAGEMPGDTARVNRVSRQVEEKPNPHPWLDSGVDHLLRERDGLRTHHGSSAEIEFADASQLRITENSLVFLQRVGRSVAGTGSDEIEIFEGQADLEATVPSPRRAKVEIVLGAARAVPQASPEGKVQTRARRAGAGGAQLMVYEGESKMAAGGVEVEVARGMGTNVPKGAPPDPPEKLLPAPAPVTPEAGSSWAFAHPSFRWQAVPGAARYTLEICLDPDCARLLERIRELDADHWTPDRLEVGQMHWRVTAVAPSGLDGYPSATQAFAVTSDRVDRGAPTGSVVVSGHSMRHGEQLVLGPGARLAVEADDDASGVAQVRYLLDGREVAESQWSSGWAAGRHSAGAEVVDQIGNRTELTAIAFLGDPDPPELTLDLGGGELLDRHGLPGADPAAPSRRQLRRMKRQAVVLEWSSDGRSWLPVTLPLGRKGGWMAPSDRVVIGRAGADRPQMFLRTSLGDPFAEGSEVRLTRGQLLRLSAEDAGAGVENLTFGVGRGDGGLFLWVETADLVGNRDGREWPLAVPRR